MPGQAFAQGLDHPETAEWNVLGAFRRDLLRHRTRRKGTGACGGHLDPGPLVSGVDDLHEKLVQLSVHGAEPVQHRVAWRPRRLNGLDGHPEADHQGERKRNDGKERGSVPVRPVDAVERGECA